MPDQDNGSEDKQHEPEQLRKLFIGGLDYNTRDDGLRSFYEQWGTVVDVVVMKDPKTRRSRGFGFITYSDAYMVDDAMSNRPHRIDGRQVEPKRAVPRDMCGKVDTNVRKLFIGGLSKAVEKEDLEEYFGRFGKLTDCAIVLTKETGEKRGFGFVEYEDTDSADKVVLMPEHELKGRRVEVKKAIAREEIMRNEKAARMAGVGRDRSNELHNRGRGGRDDYRGGNDSWNNNSGGGGNWGNNSGGGYQNPWGNNSGGGWGGNMGGNAWNNPWGGQGGFPQQGFNNMGMNPMMGMNNMGGMGGNTGYSGGYGGGYGNSSGTGGYGAGNQASNSSYNAGGYGAGTGGANTGGGYGSNTGSTAGGYGANTNSSTAGPMRPSYNANNRSTPYNTSGTASSGGGGYGGNRGGNTSGGRY